MATFCIANIVSFAASEIVRPGEVEWPGKLPRIEKFHIFMAGQDGYANFRIPGLVVTPKGTVLAFCDARKAAKHIDWATIEIYMRRSTTGGKTWEPRKRIVYVGMHEEHGYKFERNRVAVEQGLGEEGQRPITNQMPVVDKVTGDIHLFHCVEQARCFLMTSKDDGLTWSPPKEVTDVFEAFKKEYPWRVLATGPGHGIQLENGRLVIPVWLSRGGGYMGHRPSVTSVIYSDDHGKTWHAGEIAAREEDPLLNPNETIALQLADCRVMLNIRNESAEHRRGITFSADGATGWTKPVYDKTLKEPVCMASILRVSTEKTHGKSRIIFANPDNDRDGVKRANGHGLFRKNLSIKLSYDEGKTWPINKVLEPGPSGYSDLAILDDGTILCLYEDGLGKSGSFFPSKYLTLARFNLEWLTDRADTLDP